jgi:hypothetical protein
MGTVPPWEDMAPIAATGLVAIKVGTPITMVSMGGVPEHCAVDPRPATGIPMIRYVGSMGARMAPPTWGTGPAGGGGGPIIGHAWKSPMKAAGPGIAELGLMNSLSIRLTRRTLLPAK